MLAYFLRGRERRAAVRDRLKGRAGGDDGAAVRPAVGLIRVRVRMRARARVRVRVRVRARPSSCRPDKGQGEDEG